MPAEYDCREARELLGRAAGELARNSMVREAAARACLAAFARLVKDLDPEGDTLYTRSLTSSVLEFGRVHTTHCVSLAPRDYGFALRTNAGRESKIRLSYNLSSGLLESQDDDAFFAPTPGTPRNKRSALAVLAQAAIEAVTPAIPQEAT